jgi:hypothetical protein
MVGSVHFVRYHRVPLGNSYHPGLDRLGRAKAELKCSAFTKVFLCQTYPVVTGPKTQVRLNPSIADLRGAEACLGFTLAFKVLFRRGPCMKWVDAYDPLLGYLILEDTCSARGSRSALNHRPCCPRNRAALLRIGRLLSSSTRGIIVVSSLPCFDGPSARSTKICKCSLLHFARHIPVSTPAKIQRLRR